MYPIRTRSYILRSHVKNSPTLRIVKRATKSPNTSDPYVSGGLAILILFWLSAFSAGGTSIVVIRTPSDVSMAADSVGTFGHETRVVCKVHSAQGVFLAIAGIDNDLVTKFNVAKVVFKSIQSRKTFIGKMSAAITALKSALRSEALVLKNTRPTDFANLIDPEKGDLSIILFGMESGTPVAIAQSFHVSENSNGTITVVLTKTARCPGKDCPNGFYTFELGKHEAIDNFAATHSGAHLGNPADAARMFVQLEIDAHADGVGPPIDLLRVSASGLELIKHKEGCP